MSYPGGKGNCFHHIINQMPPHDLYVEPFLGGGSVFLNKRPAAMSLISDVDPDVVASFRSSNVINAGSVVLSCSPASSALASLQATISTVVYLDSPYVHSTRADKNLYRFEMTDSGHAAILGVARSLPCMILISGYRSALYDSILHDWRRVDFYNQTRNGRVLESLWCNFPEPEALHDYALLGSNARAREIIIRQQRRWKARLDALPNLERMAMLAILNDSGSTSGT